MYSFEYNDANHRQITLESHVSGKTIPFSARISVEDADFISTLEFDGARTPSEKLRGLLA